MRDVREGVFVGRLLMLGGILISLLSIFQYDSRWVSGSYEIGGSIVVWDGFENVLWPTYFFTQLIGILLVCGGIVIYLVEVKASKYSFFRSLLIVILGSGVIYYFLASSASFFPTQVALVITSYLFVSVLLTHYGDRIQRWFEAL